jgi:hypothetical protein
VLVDLHLDADLGEGRLDHLGGGQALGLAR